ncbi:MAG TPA: hypothetical protein VEJ16_05890 [Alphaproteobacteria bacterium]|nr:hypothetical protein [Alphaproteobacteria bacterium]
MRFLSSRKFLRNSALIALGASALAFAAGRTAPAALADDFHHFHDGGHVVLDFGFFGPPAPVYVAPPPPAYYYPPPVVYAPPPTVYAPPPAVYAPPPAPPAAVQAPPPGAAVQAQPSCSSGQWRQSDGSIVNGTACLQPDGTWRLTN